MSGGHGPIDPANKKIAILISILAAFLALSETGGKSAQTNAVNSNVEASNLWAYFQAKTIRQTVLRAEADRAVVDSAAVADPALKQALDAQVKRWRDTAQRYESDPKENDGRTELRNRAGAAEKKRDRSMAAYHHYEVASALFQIGIVLASAAVITGVAFLTFGAMGLGAIGLGFTAIGFFIPEAVHLIQ
jgi:hypothetical protein